MQTGDPRGGTGGRRPRRRGVFLVAEDLEARTLMASSSLLQPSAAATPATVVSILSDSTPDSKSVTVEYQIAGAALDQPFQISVERSGTSSPSDPSASVLAVATIDPTALDSTGVPAGAVGVHSISIGISGGLSIDPSREYVVASASSQASDVQVDASGASASFRIYLVGVVTHGGFESIFYGNKLPPWVLPMAKGLREAGYDYVIPFNWVSRSSDPGYAAREGPVLAVRIRDVIDSMPGSGPVDLQLIGHSEGNVVDTVALKLLAANEPEKLKEGYIKETLLDPFAASNKVSVPSYSSPPTTLGRIARWAMISYDHKANDPLIYVPTIVNESEVYYQHTPYFLTKDAYDRTLNLWGQIPVPGAQTYYNLTGLGIGHTDGITIEDWYLKNIIPLIEHHYPIDPPQDPLSASLKAQRSRFA